MVQLKAMHGGIMPWSVACTSQILGHSGGDKNTKLCFLSFLQNLRTVLKRMQCIGHLGKEWEKCKTPVHLSPSFLSPELLLLNHLKWNKCTQKEMLVKKTPLVSPVGRKKETCDLRRNQWIKWRHTLGVAWEAGRLQAQEFGESVARPGPVLQPLFSTLSVPHCSAHLYEGNFQQSAELQFHSLSYVRRAQSSADKKKDVTRGVKGNSFRDTNRTQDVFLAGKHGIYSGLFKNIFVQKSNKFRTSLTTERRSWWRWWTRLTNPSVKWVFNFFLNFSEFLCCLSGLKYFRFDSEHISALEYIGFPEISYFEVLMFVTRVVTLQKVSVALSRRICSLFV